MSSAKPSPTIIDLTTDAVPEYIHVGSDTDDNKQTGLEPNGVETDKGKRKARKKKRRKVATSADTTAAEEDGEIIEVEGPTETKPLASSSSAKKPRKRREKPSKETTDQTSRSRSPPPRKRKRSPSPQADLFFVDTKPTTLPSYPEAPLSKDTPELLLPTHVLLFDDATTVVQVLPQDSDDDDNIEFLDGDDDRRKDIVRYYDEGLSAKKRLICKHCGAEDEHSTRECHVKICLTCGARDEHTTMSCPISKTCFNCGMKGHINANCPNRRNSGAMLAANRDDCDRCGSGLHTTNECPTWWRIYTYDTADQRAATLSARKAKADIALGEGGEGYIAEDEWCYNCGANGHWGDDCEDMAHSYDLPPESSAFSKYNLTSGPFADEPSSNGHTKRRVMFRDWERDEDLPAANVGRQGRQAQMRRQQKQQERDEDDQDDWFGDRRNVLSIQGAASKKKTMTFGAIGQQKGRWEKTGPPTFSSKPSLLERMDSGNDRSSRNSSNSYGGGSGGRDLYDAGKKDKRRHRDRDRDSERNRSYRDDERSRNGERDRPRIRTHNQSRQPSPDRHGSRRRDDSSRSHDHKSSRSTRSDKEPPTGPRYRGGYSR